MESNGSMRFLTRSTVGMAVLACFAALEVHAASVKEVLEKYGLLGWAAQDCSKPASRTNTVYDYRPLDAERVQLDMMVSPTERANVMIIERVTETNPGELVLGVTDGNNGSPMEWTMRVEGQRHRMIQVIQPDGRKTIENGRFVGSGNSVPWHQKCGS